MIAVLVDFEIKPEYAEAFRAAVLAQASNSLRAEPACRQFDVCIDGENPGRVFLYELYDDRAAFDVHLKTAHFAKFNTTVSPWVAHKQIRVFEVIGGPSLKS